MKYAEFATDPCRSLFKRIAQVFTGSTPDANANVSIGKIAGRFVAQTESPLPVAFDEETLKTIGIISYGDTLKGQLTTAHPHYDQGSQFNSARTVSSRRLAVGSTELPRINYERCNSKTYWYVYASGIEKPGESVFSIPS